MTGRPLREARIDLSALKANVRSIRTSVAPAKTMVVVKAKAYGHGALECARAAVEAGTEWLGVVDITEALALRAAGIGAPILAWLHGADADFAAAVAADIDLGVSTADQLERAAATQGLAHIQLKFDTGLSRNGIEEQDVAPMLARAAALEREGRIHVRGVFSHLANAGVAEDAAQLARFEAVLEAAATAGLAPELRHLAATAGALRIPAARFDLVRVGIGVYGLSPYDGETSASLGLTPVMELSAEIVSVKRVPSGSGVSYGYTHRTEGAANLALVPLGYADGIPRAASSAAPVSINGKRYRIAGRVAMDQFIVDLGDDSVVEGDRAILFGDPTAGIPSADDWAVAADTINYEIVTRIGARVTRTFTA